MNRLDDAIKAQKLREQLHTQTARGVFVSGKVRNQFIQTLQSLDHIERTSCIKPIKGGRECPRNTSCPCGSGKKYKNCCQRKTNKWIQKET